MMLLMLLFSLFGFWKLNAASPYIPPSWIGVCRESVSNSSNLPTSLPILVELRCVVSKSHHFHWKLNHLRDWTINQSINDHSTPTNRSVVYKITVTCENGANISLPWPMRVSGLKELHVTHCLLVDKYQNMNDLIDASIPDDMKVLEIRHSFWILNQTNNHLTDPGEAINITSHYDCGQDSTLETLITSNISDIIVTSLDQADADLAAPIGVELGMLARSGPQRSPTQVVSSPRSVKPEDRLMKDMSKVISNHTNFDSGSDEIIKQTTTTTQNDEDAAHEAELDHLKILRKILNTRTKCNYKKLKLIDESIWPLTSLHHFEFMIQGADYPVLEDMNYSYTGLREVPKQLSEWRIYFPKLRNIDLSHNYISDLKVPAFPSNSKIDVKFDLRFNNFTSVTMDVLKSWAAVDNFFVDIRDNPIHCDCQMADLLPFLEDNSTFTGNLAPYEYIRHLSCRTPEVLAGKQLFSLTKNSLSCPDYDSNKTTVIVLSVIMIILVVVIIVIIRFKVEIRILLYTRLHIRFPCDMDAQTNNKLFDAFVSYSNEDSNWVCENLITFLEKSPKNNKNIDNNSSSQKNGRKSQLHSRSFKLCVHQRDFIPGKTIFDNIIDSIEASRHTIIVLSPSFMRSHWAMEELRQAYRQSLVEKTRHLIVILLEKVSKDEMDPLISRCCKTFTYLEVSDTLFKDRLVFSLTTKDKGARRRDRLAEQEKQASKVSGQHAESQVYDSIDECNVYDNTAYFPSPGRPPEPERELSNMSTSSTAGLTSSTA